MYLSNYLVGSYVGKPSFHLRRKMTLKWKERCHDILQKMGLHARQELRSLKGSFLRFAIGRSPRKTLFARELKEEIYRYSLVQLL